MGNVHYEILDRKQTHDQVERLEGYVLKRLT